MIKQGTAKAIFNCYAEIKNSEKLISKIEEQENEIEEKRKNLLEHEDLKERYSTYELGVPYNFGPDNSSFRLYYINPSIAKAVIVAHQATQKARLVELNQIARLECDMEEEFVTEKRIAE